MFVLCFFEGGASAADLAYGGPCSRVVEYGSGKCSIAVVQTHGAPPPDVRGLNVSSAEESIHIARCLIETRGSPVAARAGTSDATR